MKTENPEPDQARLGSLLREARPAPPLPPRFQETVWRRIETGEGRAEPLSPLSWVDQLVERLLRPRFALASIAALLVLSGLAGVLSGAATARQTAQTRYFSAVAPTATR
jgi:hypothetical protein